MSSWIRSGSGTTRNPRPDELQLDPNSAQVQSLRQLARRHVVESDHPLAIALTHQPGVDSILRLARSVEAVTADQLRGVGRQHFDLDVEEMQRAACFR